MFKETEEIVLEMSSLYEGVIGKLHYLGDDDYKSALNWIRKAKCAFTEGFRREHGAGSWRGPRPNCPLVFPSGQGKPNYRFLHDRRKVVAKRAGIDPNLWHLHRFRDTAATR
jgi:integrase